MAKGDFLIYKNTSNNADVLPNAGGTIDVAWDTEVIDEGSAATYSAGTFTLTNTAPYLIMYTEKWSTTDVTNNQRIEGQGRLRLNGTTNLIEAASEGYIRKSSGQQSMVMQGVSIVNATAGDTIDIRFYRGDTSTVGVVTRDAGFGGVQIIELDAADDFARYSTNATNAMTSTEANVSNWTNDEEETGFSRTTDTVTITNAGRYLMIFSGATSETGTSRIGATIFAENGTPITGVRGYSHMRGAEGNQNGALSFAAVIDVAASDTITLRSDCDSGGMTLDSGAKWQFWELPSGNETAIMEATNGNMNASGDFAWDTLPQIDTAGFTATAGNANIDVDQNSHLLVFWNQGKTVVDTVQRAYPMGQVSVDGTPVGNIASGAYHRNSGSIGTFMVASGAGLVPNVPNGSSVTIENTPIGAVGTLDVDSGHFSIINLEGLYKSYTYILPVQITDVDTDNIITNTQLNVVATGAEFEAVQSTGKVELVENFDYTGTIINQTNIDSWSDTSIQFDVTAGVLADTNCFLAITNASGSRGIIAIQLGLPPETYQEAVEAMALFPDHYWRFQNSYVDEIGSATANNGSGGTPTFDTGVKICRGDTHSLLLNSTTDYISPADQIDMNTANISRRYIGGWFQVDNVSQTLSVIYEEGAQVNNIALLNGFGNNAMFQIANAADDYIQTYFDVPLVPNRAYHVLLEFNASGFSGGICSLYVDGLLQSRTNGNPWETAQLDSHSGNITWGHEGTEELKVGDDRGVDATTIAFVSPTACNYAHWYSWSGVTLNATSDIRVTLFEKGAEANVTISSGTESVMQIAADALADLVGINAPLDIRIEEVIGGGVFELTLDNRTFDPLASIHIQYIGAGTLTLVQEAGTLIDTNKISTPFGGTVVIEDNVAVTVEVRDIDDNSLIENATVILEASVGGDLPTGTDIIKKLTNVSGIATENLRYTNDQPITGVVREAPGVGSQNYQESPIAGTISNTGLNLTIFLIKN